jgi:DNA polymerase-3 subunit alpha
MENTSINKTQIETMIKLNYFSDYGYNLKLLKLFGEFKDGENQYKKTYADKTKEKRIVALKQYENSLEDEKLSIKEHDEFEMKILGHPWTVYDLPKIYVYITSVDTTYSPKVGCYCIANGKSEIMKIDKKTFAKNKIKPGDIIKLLKSTSKPKSKKVGNDWIPIPNTKEWWILNYQVIDL